MSGVCLSIRCLLGGGCRYMSAVLVVKVSKKLVKAGQGMAYLELDKTRL